MAENKKFSAREAAVAVLAKAHELLGKSESKKSLAKAENEIGTNAKKEKNDVLHKEEKMPAGEIHPKEQVQGEPAKPAARIEGQKAPEANPHEQKEGNNPEWGAEPGHYKLAKFCGHMSAKRKMRTPKV